MLSFKCYLKNVHLLESSSVVMTFKNLECSGLHVMAHMD